MYWVFGKSFSCGYNARVITRHFFKTLILFTIMILLGLTGAFIVNYLEQSKNLETADNAEPCKTGEVC